MTDNVLALDFNGVKVILDANTRLVRLTVPSGVTADTTFHDSTDDSNYQVPVGKKAKIIYLEQIDSNDVNNSWGYADNLDGDTNAVDLIKTGSATGLTNLIFISASVPAQKFVNFLFTSGGSTGDQIIYVIEEDA